MATDLATILNSADPNAIYQQIANSLGISMGAMLVILAIISIWSLVWKGFALWKSARKNSTIWFIIILVVNTVGILEILYIYVFSEMGKKKSSSAPEPVAKKKKM